MSVRRADTEEARAFWAFVDATSKQVAKERPVWAQPQAEARGDYRHTWRHQLWRNGDCTE